MNNNNQSTLSINTSRPNEESIESFGHSYLGASNISPSETVPPITLSFVGHARDNVIRNSVTIGWMDFIEWISNHEIRENKEDGVLFNAASFRDNEGTGYIRRCAENVEFYTALILDFDGELSIATARQRYRDYTYCGYTSYSHKSPKKQGVDCFRLIFPLACEVAPSEIRARREALTQFAQGADPSTFAISRVFYTPSCPESTAQHASSWINDGKLLNLYDLRNLPPLSHQIRQPGAPDRGDISNEEREILVSRLSNCFVGFEPTWSQVALACVSNNFTLEQFQRITAGMMRDKTPHDAARKWQHALSQAAAGKSRSLGYLYNTLKGKHNRG